MTGTKLLTQVIETGSLSHQSHPSFYSSDASATHPSTATTPVSPLKWGKHKEPLQILQYRGLICIINPLLQVAVAAAPTCAIQIELQSANRCDTVPDKSTISSMTISWEKALGNARPKLGHDNYTSRLHLTKL